MRSEAPESRFAVGNRLLPDSSCQFGAEFLATGAVMFFLGLVTVWIVYHEHSFSHLLHIAELLITFGGSIVFFVSGIRALCRSARLRAHRDE